MAANVVGVALEAVVLGFDRFYFAAIDHAVPAVIDIRLGFIWSALAYRPFSIARLLPIGRRLSDSLVNFRMGPAAGAAASTIQVAAASPAPLKAATMTTTQGGAFHAISNTKQVSATVKSRRSLIALVKRGD